MNSIKQIDSDIKDYEAQLEIANALDRLLSNKDFKAVIIEGYLRDYVSDLVCQLNYPEFAQMKDFHEEAIKGVSGFSMYLRQLRDQQHLAAKNLDDARETRQSMLRAED